MRAIIRFYLRWKIQLCLNEGQKPGSFLAWWIEHDAPTRLYYHQMQQLDLLLCSEADVSGPVVHARQLPPRPSFSSARLFRWSSIAAVLLLSVGLGSFFLIPQSEEKPTVAVSVPQQKVSPFAELVNPSVEPIRSTILAGKEVFGEQWENSGLSILTQLASDLSTSNDFLSELGDLMNASKSEKAMF